MKFFIIIVFLMDNFDMVFNGKVRVYFMRFFKDVCKIIVFIFVNVSVCI